MIGLFGVLTAAALTCTSMQQSCVVTLETQALAVSEQGSTVPVPREKPLRKSEGKEKPGKTVSRAENSRSEDKIQSPKRKEKVVLQDTVRKTKRKPVLLIGNYY